MALTMEKTLSGWSSGIFFERILWLLYGIPSGERQRVWPWREGKTLTIMKEERQGGREGVSLQRPPEWDPHPSPSDSGSSGRDRDVLHLRLLICKVRMLPKCLLWLAVKDKSGNRYKVLARCMAPGKGSCFKSDCNILLSACNIFHNECWLRRAFIPQYPEWGRQLRK